MHGSYMDQIYIEHIQILNSTQTGFDSDAA